MVKFSILSGFLELLKVGLFSKREPFLKIAAGFYKPHQRC